MLAESESRVEIYTDGACAGNPGPGGWGVYMIFGHESKKFYGSVANTTNNRMEMTAVIEALQRLEVASKVNLYTDSKYVKDGITSWVKNWEQNGWRKYDNTAVKNVDLWKLMLSICKKHDVQWHWVQGHNGCYGNEIADQLAGMGVKKL